MDDKKKCFYCEKQGKYFNPYNGRVYCKEHAIKKMNDYIGELKEYDADGLRDWFEVYHNYDKKFRNCSLDTKTGKIIFN